MSLKDITLKYETEEDNRDSVEDYRIILQLEEKIRTLQAKNSELEDKLFEYGMDLLSSDEVEELKERNLALESENVDLKNQLIKIESEKSCLLEIIKEKDIEIASLNEELSKRKKGGRPAKFDIYITKVQGLYSELQSVSKVVNALHSEGIEISVAQVKRMIKKSVA